MEPKRISVAEVKKRLDNGEPIFFIDTRSPHSWEGSDVKIPGSRRIHYNDLPQHLGEIPRDRLIVTYCT
jgi:rhodanese-related sulfurtransferase